MNESFGDFVVDIFAEEPFDFDSEYANAHRAHLPGVSGELPFVAKATLLEMKERASRAIDLDDIKHLSG